MTMISIPLIPALASVLVLVGQLFLLFKFYEEKNIHAFAGTGFTMLFSFVTFFIVYGFISYFGGA